MFINIKSERVSLNIVFIVFKVKIYLQVHELEPIPSHRLRRISGEISSALYKWGEKIVIVILVIILVTISPQCPKLLSENKPLKLGLF